MKHVDKCDRKSAAEIERQDVLHAAHIVFGTALRFLTDAYYTQIFVNETVEFFRFPDDTTLCKQM